MFTIQAGILTHHNAEPAETLYSGTNFNRKSELEALIKANPGNWAVQLWNQLPGVTPINTPKFRNRQTAVERIWNKLAELYPDAILPEDMPKKMNPLNAARKPKKIRSYKKPRQNRKTLFTGVKRSKPGTPSKRDKVIELLKRKAGASVPELCEKTGWKPAAVNGILQWISWVTGKGVKRLESQVNASGKRTYRAA